MWEKCEYKFLKELFTEYKPVKDNLIHKTTYDSTRKDKAPVFTDESKKWELTDANKIEDIDFYAEWVCDARWCKEYSRQLAEQFWLTDYFTIDLTN